jgi:hypothetical protein
MGTFQMVTDLRRQYGADYEALSSFVEYGTAPVVQDAWSVIHPVYTVQVGPVHATDSEEHDMSETTEYVHLFDDTIKALFSDAVRITLRDLSVAEEATT